MTVNFTEIFSALKNTKQRRDNSIGNMNIAELELAIKQGNDKARYELMMRRRGKKVTQEIVDLFRKSAEAGDPDAQRWLGECYLNGNVVSKDYELAVQWFRKCAAQGNVNGQVELGACYYNGKGVPKDYSQALHWIRQAVEQGHASAQNTVSTCYNAGHGLPKNKAEALYWVQQSAEQGNPAGQYDLGLCYYYGDGVPKNLIKALDLFRKSAEQEDAYAQCRLGICYYNGQGVPKNFRLAVRWFRLSAEQECENGQCQLGFCYQSGQGVPKDLREAVVWFRKASEGGNSIAQYQLGLCYYHGRGVQKDNKIALDHLRLAAAQGHDEAQSMLGPIESKIKGDSSRDSDKILSESEIISERNRGIDDDLNKRMRDLVEALPRLAPSEYGDTTEQPETRAKKIVSYFRSQLTQRNYCIEEPTDIPDLSNFSLMISTIKINEETIRINRRVLFSHDEFFGLATSFTAQMCEAFKNTQDRTEILEQEISTKLFKQVLTSFLVRKKSIHALVENQMEIKRQKELKARESNLLERFGALRNNFNRTLYVETIGNEDQRDIKYALDCLFEDIEHVKKETESLDNDLRSISGSQASRFENNKQRREALDNIRVNLEKVKKEAAFKKLQEEFEKAYEDNELLIHEAMQEKPMTEVILQRITNYMVPLENFVERGERLNKELNDFKKNVSAIQQELFNVWEAISRKLGRREKEAKETILSQREEIRKKESASRQERWRKIVAKKEETSRHRQKALQEKLDREKNLRDKEKSEVEEKKNKEGKEKKSEENNALDITKKLLDLQRAVVPLREIQPNDSTPHANQNTGSPNRSIVNNFETLITMRRERLGKTSPDALRRFLQEEKLLQECVKLKRILENLLWLNEGNPNEKQGKEHQEAMNCQRINYLIERNALLYVLAYMMDRILEMNGINCFPRETARKIRNYIFHVYGRAYLLSLNREASDSMKNMVLEILIYLQNNLGSEDEVSIDEATLLTKIRSELFRMLLTETATPSLEECERQIELTKKDFEEYEAYRIRQVSLSTGLQQNRLESLEAAERWSRARRGAFAAKIRDYYGEIFRKNRCEYESYIEVGRFVRHSVEGDSWDEMEAKWVQDDAIEQGIHRNPVQLATNASIGSASSAHPRTVWGLPMPPLSETGRPKNALEEALRLAQLTLAEANQKNSVTTAIQSRII